MDEVKDRCGERGTHSGTGFGLVTGFMGVFVIFMVADEQLLRWFGPEGFGLGSTGMDMLTFGAAGAWIALSVWLASFVNDRDCYRHFMLQAQAREDALRKG